MQIRNRIKELRQVKASELLPNPKNWRTHPVNQVDALKGLLAEIGYADALIAYESPDGLMLIDGHLRAETTPDMEVPVLITDLDEGEANKLLMTLDPLANMAIANEEQLKILMEKMQFNDKDVNDMLDSLANGELVRIPNLQDLIQATDSFDEWINMPEYEHEDKLAWKQLVVNFESKDDLVAFANLIQQAITEQTKSVWFPKAERVSAIDKRYIENGNAIAAPLLAGQYTEKEIIVRGIKVIVRENTSDEFVANEVLGGEYRKLKIQPTDTVLDIGLNIGMASIWAIRQGATKVIGYEPDKDNYRLAGTNIALNDMSDRIIICNDAVIGNNDTTRTFSINLKRNKGAHSLIAKRGRDSTEVSCININDILDKYHPDIIKIDTEGGEYEILRAINSFNGIREMILEFHHAHLNDIPAHEKYNEILTLLRSHFTRVEARPAEVLGGAWTGIIYCNES